MNIDEMQTFVLNLSEVTGRHFNDAQIGIWFAALGGYTEADCTKALHEHLAQSSGFLTPADIANRVKEIRMNRLNAAGTPPNPPEYIEGEDWAEYQKMYLKWQATWTENVANGVASPMANKLAVESVGRPLAIEAATIPYRNSLVLKGTETL